MRFLVFLNQLSANAANTQIDDNGRTLFAARGFGVDVDGNVEAKRLSDGAINHDAKTETWDIPRQRLDTKWIISHPENAMRSDIVIDGEGTTAVEVIMAGVVYDTIEEYDEAWFAGAPE